MRRHDPYDVSVAFDDIYGNEAAPVSQRFVGPSFAAWLGHTAGALLRQARKRRLPPPPMQIIGVSYDPTYHHFEVADVNYQLIGAEYKPKYHGFEIADVAYQLIGADYEPHYHQFEAADVAYQLIGEEAAATDDFPIYSGLRKQFQDMTPPPKLVRLDTVETYKDFREARRAPYVSNLEARLRALEDAFQRHIADHHGDRIDDLEYQFDRHLAEFHSDPEADISIQGEAVMQAAGAAAAGGQKVPLPLADWAKGKVDCWQDGNQVLCTIRVLGHDGDVRMITSGVPLERHVEEVLGYAERINAPVDHVLEVTPVLAPVLAGATLLPQLCKVAPDLVARPEAMHGAFVGQMSSASDPSLAAAMALVQHCQKGDQVACSEMARIVHSGQSGYSLMTNAVARLARAQQEKNRRSA